MSRNVFWLAYVCVSSKVEIIEQIICFPSIRIIAFSHRGFLVAARGIGCTALLSEGDPAFEGDCIPPRVSESSIDDLRQNRLLLLRTVGRWGLLDKLLLMGVRSCSRFSRLLLSRIALAAFAAGVGSPINFLRQNRLLLLRWAVGRRIFKRNLLLAGL